MTNAKPSKNGGGLDAIATALGEATTASYDRAWSVPGSFYHDPAMLALEREHLFLRGWLCIGRIEELARPGDYMAIEILDEPLVAVHGVDGRIRAFSNVCRHRGMTVATGQGNAKALMCPYHHWSYDTTGRLIAAPRLPVRPDFDTADCRLPEFPLTEWQGFVFVCLGSDPPPLLPQLAGLEPMIRPYHLEQTTLRYVAIEVWPTNWKILLENFMEGYHLSALHHDTLHKVNPTRLCRHFPPGDAYFGYFAGFAPEMPRSHRGHPDLTDPERDDCVMFAVPPGFAVGCASDYSSFMCIQPKTIDSVQVKLGLIFYGQDWAQDEVDRAVELFRNTMAEDKTILAGVARGLKSRHYRRGPLAPADYEGTILDFYRYLNRRVGPMIAAGRGRRQP